MGRILICIMTVVILLFSCASVDTNAYTSPRENVSSEGITTVNELQPEADILSNEPRKVPKDDNTTGSEPSAIQTATSSAVDMTSLFQNIPVQNNGYHVAGSNKANAHSTLALLKAAIISLADYESFQMDADTSQVRDEVEEYIATLHNAFLLDESMILSGFDWNSITHASLLTNGNTYIGEELENDGEIPDGDGIVIFADGRVFIGEISDSSRQGLGLMSWPSGAAYFGEWQNDRMNGIGILYISADEIWAGDFINDSLEDGINMMAVDGNTYFFEYDRGARTGQILIEFENGAIYLGAFMNRNLHGNGMMIYQNGDIYYGRFLNSRRNGYGTYEFSTGESLEGTWATDKFVKGK